MWDKDKSITDTYIDSYMKLGISEEQKNYVIDAQAELTKILWSEMTKEDRRKYLLIRR